MTERHLVIDHLKFSYEGLFNAAELYNVISSYFFGKNWEWYEKMNQETVTPSGKQIRIVLEPWKNVSDYYKLHVKIKLNMVDIKEVEIEHNDKMLKLSQGLVRITFDGYVTADRKELWTKPVEWFLSVILEKYFYRHHLAKFENWIKADIDTLLHKIKTFLNTYKYVTNN